MVVTLAPALQRFQISEWKPERFQISEWKPERFQISAWKYVLFFDFASARLRVVVCSGGREEHTILRMLDMIPVKKEETAENEDIHESI
jgi:hypothetical protein